MFSEKPIKDFLDELASGSPIPGGGSAAALSGASGAALVSMVCNLTIGREKYKDAESEMKEILAKAEGLRASLLAQLEADIEAYGALAQAFKMPKDSDQAKTARSAAIQQALVTATKVPLEIGRLCGEVMSLCPAVAAMGNLNAVSDVGVAVAVAEAGLCSARLNVKINLATIKDKACVAQISEALDSYTSGKSAFREEVLREVEARL